MNLPSILENPSFCFRCTLTDKKCSFCRRISKCLDVLNNEEMNIIFRKNSNKQCMKCINDGTGRCKGCKMSYFCADHKIGAYASHYRNDCKRISKREESLKEYYAINILKKIFDTTMEKIHRYQEEKDYWDGVRMFYEEEDEVSDDIGHHQDSTHSMAMSNKMKGDEVQSDDPDGKAQSSRLINSVLGVSETSNLANEIKNSAIMVSIKESIPHEVEDNRLILAEIWHSDNDVEKKWISFSDYKSLKHGVMSERVIAVQLGEELSMEYKMSGNRILQRRKNEILFLKRKKEGKLVNPRRRYVLNVGFDVDDYWPCYVPRIKYGNVRTNWARPLFRSVGTRCTKIFSTILRYKDIVKVLEVSRGLDHRIEVSKEVLKSVGLNIEEEWVEIGKIQFINLKSCDWRKIFQSI